VAAFLCSYERIIAGLPYGKQHRRKRAAGSRCDALATPGSLGDVEGDAPGLGAVERRPMAKALTASLDHLVGGHKQRRGHGEPKRLRRLEIDGQFEFGRLEDGDVGRFRTVQNLADYNGEPVFLRQLND
jgi:hypothetical protein